MARNRLTAKGVYDRNNSWQVRVRRRDRDGRFHNIVKTFPYLPEAPQAHPHSRASQFHEAELFAASERASLRFERQARADDVGNQPLVDWLDRYEREETPKKKSAIREASTLSRLKELAPELLARPAGGLRPGDFVGTTPGCLEEIMVEAQYAPATIRRYLTTVSHVYTTARSRWRYEGDHPLRAVQKPASHDERDRLISADEWELLEKSWGDCEPATVAALRWLRWTAARRGEAVALSWADIDWSTTPPTAHLKNTKSRHDRPTQSRHIPLFPEAVAALRRLRGKSWPKDGPVFGGLKGDSLTRAWTRACERAEIANARVHDLRHTRITELAPALPLQVLARITGHREPSTLMRYYNPTGKDAATAGRAFANYQAAQAEAERKRAAQGKRRKTGSQASSPLP